METNIFTGAERGFLASNLKKHIKGANINYGNVLLSKQYDNIDKIFHFAGPSDDFDFEDSETVVDVIVNGTINMLQLAKQTNAKFIFASTKGVETPNNVYCYSKLLMEKYIQNNYDNYIILRIPRVYDKTRKKGLMKKLRLNLVPEKDMNNQIEFLTLNNFIEQTLKVVNSENIVYNYKDLHCDTIANIKKLYT
jgi:nucleoside-diphosphate-sugar epimerase